MRDPHALGEPEREYVDAMTILIQDYQQKHPLEHSKSTPLQRLKFLVKESGMSVGDLGRVIGSQPAASLVLSGKRELSKAHIRRLAERFKINPGYFL